MMHYRVYDHTKRGKVFATLQEAEAYAMFYQQQTRIVCLIEATTAKVTHEWTGGQK